MVRIFLFLLIVYISELLKNFENESKEQLKKFFPPGFTPFKPFGAMQ